MTTMEPSEETSGQAVERRGRLPDISIPMIELVEKEGQRIPRDVLREVQRATAVTLNEMGEDMTKYRRGLTPLDLIDTTPDEDGFRRYRRLPGADTDIPVVIVSSQPVLDTKGREVIAMETPDHNTLTLNLRRLDDYFSAGANSLPQAIKAGIVITEEVIHYVQHTLLGRELEDTTDSAEDITAHLRHPIEQEAARLKKDIYRKLYPDLDIQLKGVDF